ncbi:thiol-disulfide oxidoreductase DCC family protein [Picosynechococcus sp. PCC 8807]|uniref:thiol-disulfide oxidoreductase DCC family protein n=1 Tax=Picosynechococcus sp. PCC 8807 TaxID=195248 RepID=UPI0008104906|nr:DUF393 domain-containing protein [Picosynechococcus sp. PCC 8807]ANV90432.1 thiol-disulfide oxidoreductase [Picosynechococcus sp. PCC 8807]
MSSTPSWKIKLLYDGQCPLCLREVNFLRRKDNGRGLICFVDVAADDYDPSRHGGVTFRAAMERIHGVLADGTVLQNVAVFRSVYEVLGLGWVYGITKIPGVGQLADWVYSIWAKYRLQLTGRPDLITLIQNREARQTCSVGDRCRLETSVTNT